MDEVILTTEQQAERIEDIVRAGAVAEIRGAAVGVEGQPAFVGSDGVADSRRGTSHWSPSPGRRSFGAKKGYLRIQRELP